MRDCNEEALARYEEEVACGERAIEQFNDDIEPCLERIDEILDEIKSIANHFEGYDMDEIISERIKDLL